MALICYYVIKHKSIANKCWKGLLPLYPGFGNDMISTDFWNLPWHMVSKIFISIGTNANILIYFGIIDMFYKNIIILFFKHIGKI